MLNEGEEITLNEAYPVTDEEGKKQEGYTFTIKNTCNTKASYEVNLEELAVTKKLSSEHIKVSINESKGSIVGELKESTPTIKEANESHTLTSGSLNPNESKQYTIKLWMDEETPATEETMEAEYKSKVTITNTYEENTENEIEIAYESLETDYVKESERIKVTGTNSKYNIIEYSFDNLPYERVTNESQTVEEEIEVTDENKTYSFTYRDEKGNEQTENIKPSKLDQTGPNIEVQETGTEEGALLTITFTDNKSGLKEYFIDDGEVTSLNGETQEKNHTYTENKTITIHAKDKLDNESTKEYEIKKSDLYGPIITIENPKENEWTNESVRIELRAEDKLSNIDKFYYKKENEEEWQEIETIVNEKIGTATLTLEEEQETTYEIKAKDIHGNESETKRTVVKIDKGDPEISEITNLYRIFGNVPYRKFNYEEDAGVDGTWVTSTKDPQLSFDDVTHYNQIQGIYIELSEPVSKSMAVEIYYAYQTADYSSQRVKSSSIQKNATALYIEIPKDNYTSIRVDIGYEAGLSYKIKNIALAAESNMWNNGDISEMVTFTDSLSGFAYCEKSDNNSTYVKDEGILLKDNKYITSSYTIEGNTIKYLRCIDQANNKSTSKSTSIKIDKSTPQISEITNLYRIFGNVSYRAFNYEADVGINGTWVTKTNDPQLSFDDVTHYSKIKGVYVELETSVSKSMTVEIFYTDTSTYSQEKSMIRGIFPNERSLYIAIPEGNYKSIRVDIGYEVGLSYKIKNIALAAESNIWNNSDMSEMVTFTDSLSGFAYCEKRENNTYIKDEGILLKDNKYITSSYIQDENSTKSLRCADQANNKSTLKSTSVKIDKVNPIANIKSVTVKDKSIMIDASTSSDVGSEIATYYYSINNGQTWQSSSTSSFTFTDASAGNHNVFVKVKDYAGNESSVATSTAYIEPSTIELFKNGKIYGQYSTQIGSSYSKNFLTIGNTLHYNDNSEEYSGDSILNFDTAIDLTLYKTITLNLKYNSIAGNAWSPPVGIYLIVYTPENFTKAKAMSDYSQALSLAATSQKEGYMGDPTTRTVTLDITNLKGNYNVALYFHSIGTITFDVEATSIEITP